jgi:hypothetical protein
MAKNNLALINFKTFSKSLEVIPVFFENLKNLVLFFADQLKLICYIYDRWQVLVDFG